MSIIQALFAFLVAPLTLAAETSPAMAHQASTPLSCEIRATEVPGGLELLAVVMSSSGVSGEYDLVIAKSGGGGTSNISQGGSFEVGAGEETVLGEATLGPGEGARVRADLTVTSDDGKTCEATYP